MPEITLHVNGREHRLDVPDRMLLTDALRQRLGLTGTHVGCEHGVCGVCTILLDDQPVRACLTLAVQADGHRIRTIESVAPSAQTLHPVQKAMRDCHGLQCGFCTPGIVMSLVALHEKDERPDAEEVDEALSGHLCRCTGYRNITEAAHRALGCTPAAPAEPVGPAGAGHAPEGAAR